MGEAAVQREGDFYVVGCPKCQTQFKIAAAKVPDTGARMRCSSCDEGFEVHHPAIAEPSFEEGLPPLDLEFDGATESLEMPSEPVAGPPEDIPSLELDQPAEATTEAQQIDDTALDLGIVSQTDPALTQALASDDPFAAFETPPETSDASEEIEDPFSVPTQAMPAPSEYAPDGSMAAAQSMDIDLDAVDGDIPIVSEADLVPVPQPLPKGSMPARLIAWAIVGSAVLSMTAGTLYALTDGLLFNGRVPSTLGLQPGDRAAAPFEGLKFETLEAFNYPTRMGSALVLMGGLKNESETTYSNLAWKAEFISAQGQTVATALAHVGLELSPADLAEMSGPEAFDSWVASRGPLADTALEAGEAASFYAVFFNPKKEYISFDRRYQIVQAEAFPEPKAEDLVGPPAPPALEEDGDQIRKRRKGRRGKRRNRRRRGRR